MGLLFNVRNVQFTCRGKKGKSNRRVTEKLQYVIIIKYIEIHQPYEAGMTWTVWQTDAK